MRNKSKKKNQDGDENDDYDELAWVILTSANLSQAAWGSLQKKDTQYVFFNSKIDT